MLKPAAVLALFLFGFVGSRHLSGPDTASDSPGPDDPPPVQNLSHARLPPVLQPPTEKMDRARADELFKEGRPDQALAAYQTLAAARKIPPASDLSYRMALCHEELAAWDNALRIYQDLVQHGRDAEAAAAQLGQGAVHFRRGQPGEASALLWPLVLQAGRFGPECAAPCRSSLSAGSIACRGQRRRHLRARKNETLPPARMPWRLEASSIGRRLDLPKPAEKVEEKIVVTQANAGSEPVLVEAFVPRSPVLQSLERLAKAGNLQMSWSPKAEKAVEGRLISMALANRNLLDVLQAMLAPYDLVCRIDDGQASIACAEEVRGDVLMHHRRLQAKRALQSAALVHPNHALTPAAYLALGNLEAGHDLTEALAWYERLLQEHPRSRLTLEAAFKRGALLQQAGKYPEAQKAFFQVADEAPGHPLTPHALLRIGRMRLEAGELQKAVSILKRSHALATDVPTRAVAALTLGAALALSEQPRATTELLSNHREPFQVESCRQSAAFLAAYARHRSAAQAKQVRREDTELLAALMAWQDDAFQGGLGQLLKGLAYADLGMLEQVVPILEKALPHEQGPLAREMTFRLADALARTKKTAEATRLFTELAESKGPWSHQAHFELATLDLQGDRIQSCLDRCRQLLGEPSTLSHAAILNVMGRAYERQGRFDQAARCFAGNVPE